MNFAFTLVHWGIFQQQNIFGSQLAKCCKANTNFRISCLEDTECFPQEHGQIMFSKSLFFSTFIQSDIVFQPRSSVDIIFFKKKLFHNFILLLCFRIKLLLHTSLKLQPHRLCQISHNFIFLLLMRFRQNSKA